MDESKNQIISISALSISDILSGDFCTNCLHHKNEHSIGKCYALSYNGLIWSACSCLHLKIDLTMKVGILKDLEEIKEVKKDETSNISTEISNDSKITETKSEPTNKYKEFKRI